MSSHVLRRVLLHGLVLIATTCSGCGRSLTAKGPLAADVIEGQAAKEHLLRIVQALRDAPFVEISGNTSNSFDNPMVPYHLLMGPDGKLACRCGRMSFYYDGVQVVSVDHGTSPPARSVIASGSGLAGEAYMGVHHVLGGPFPIALAKLANESTWFAELASHDGEAVFEERRMADNGLEFRVTANQGEQHRFVFAGPGRIPASYAWYGRGSQDKPMYVRTIERITFPKSVQESAFTAP